MRNHTDRCTYQNTLTSLILDRSGERLTRQIRTTPAHHSITSPLSSHSHRHTPHSTRVLSGRHIRLWSDALDMKCALDAAQRRSRAEPTCGVASSVTPGLSAHLIVSALVAEGSHAMNLRKARGDDVDVPRNARQRHSNNSLEASTSTAQTRSEKVVSVSVTPQTRPDGASSVTTERLSEPSPIGRSVA